MSKPPSRSGCHSCDCELVTRLPVKFTADDRWVVTRPFMPGGEIRVRRVLDRIAKMSSSEASAVLRQVETQFASRHRWFEAELRSHFEQAVAMVPQRRDLDPTKQLLAGAYFTMEYAFASAALFNPSIVSHPDQTGVAEDSLRFVMSLRATGEGHISSIVFRTGVIGPRHEIVFDPPAEHRHRMRVSPDRRYDRNLFRRKLMEMVVEEQAVELVLGNVTDSFTFVELEHAIENAYHDQADSIWLRETMDSMTWLARENYQLKLPPEADLSEMVVFPQSDNESMGIEDLRLVRFVDDDYQVTYYGTYSAYNGTQVLPQLMATKDFHQLNMHTLNGACVQNKGLALFPRRIGGRYWMCSRLDGENLYLMSSDVVEFWETAELLQTPKHPWEFMQIGNCGSPIETSEGWLMLTHGVGPMRGYCIGAMLLDRDDPQRVIGHLKEPLIVPSDEEREGYVPNVVYTCGAIVHDECLFVPYAMSDVATGFAVVPLGKLLDKLLDSHIK